MARRVYPWRARVTLRRVPSEPVVLRDWKLQGEEVWASWGGMRRREVGVAMAWRVAGLELLLLLLLMWREKLGQDRSREPPCVRERRHSCVQYELISRCPVEMKPQLQAGAGEPSSSGATSPKLEGLHHLPSLPPPRPSWLSALSPFLPFWPPPLRRESWLLVNQVEYEGVGRLV